MGRMTLLGVGTIAAAAAGGGVTFIGSTTAASGTGGTIPIHASAVAGQLAVAQIYGLAGSTLIKGGASSAVAFSDARASSRWDAGSTNASSNFCGYHFRVLDSTDISRGTMAFSGGDASFGAASLYIFDGATVAVANNVQDYDNNGGSTSHTTTGFSPSGSTKGAVILTMNRVNPADISAPTNWSLGQANTATAVPFMAMVHRLSGYAGGTVAVSKGSAWQVSSVIMLELQ